MGEVLLDCSCCNYPDTTDKDGLTGVFYSDKDTQRLRYYSDFFNNQISRCHFNLKMTKNVPRGMPTLIWHNIRVSLIPVNIELYDIRVSIQKSIGYQSINLFS